MKNLIDITGWIDTAHILKPPCERFVCDDEIMRFVKPPVECHEVIFNDSPVRYVKMNYLFYNDCPGIIGLIQENVVLPAYYSKLVYVLSAEGRELRVVCCVDDFKYNARVRYRDRYPYILLPGRYGESIEWEYMLTDHIHVHCASVTLIHKIDGVACDTLTVLREITGVETGKSIDTTEYYVAGMGIRDMHTERNK